MDRETETRSRRNERLWDKHWERSMQRMDKFDKQLQAPRNLVELGMKLMVRLTRRVDALTVNVDNLAVTVRDLGKRQDAFLRSFGNGRSGGNGRRRSP